MIIQSKEYNRGPIPSDSFPTDMKSYTNITWDYQSTRVRKSFDMAFCACLGTKSSLEKLKEEILFIDVDLLKDYADRKKKERKDCQVTLYNKYTL